MGGDTDILIVGGGFYGCAIAARLAGLGRSVRLLERSETLLGRASYTNQARVHQGYHYPRSLITGFRSRANYGRFTELYADCVVSNFDKYYAVGREYSKVTAAQFALFCRRIGAPIAPAPAAVKKLFDPNAVEEVFRVEEIAFNAARLRARMARELADAGVEVLLGAEALRVAPAAGGLRLEARRRGWADAEYTARHLFNCTYSGLNELAARSGLPPTPLKHEIAEMALVAMPDDLRGIGVTVMCGPFFSCMPFPDAGLHTLSHVRYTPHAAWAEPRPDGRTAEEVFAAAPKVSAFDRMRRDSARFLPGLARAEYGRSIWEVKTVLPANEADDGRPILFRADAGLPGYHLVLGAKIDNIFDILERIEAELFGEVQRRAA